MAAALNTDSGEPGEETRGASEGSVAVMRVKNEGGSGHRGGEERNNHLLDVF